MEWVREQWEKRDLGDPTTFVAVGSLMRLHQIMLAGIERVLKPFGLNRNTYLLLTTLVLSDRGKSRLSQLARGLMVHPTTVTLLADRLEQQRLIARSPHPTDRRATYAIITPAGRALMKKASRALAEADFGLPGLNVDNAAALAELTADIRIASGDSMS
jgi:DNA-binding MarR family transcriptional regulator